MAESKLVLGGGRYWVFHYCTYNLHALKDLNKPSTRAKFCSSWSCKIKLSFANNSTDVNGPNLVMHSWAWWMTQDYGQANFNLNSWLVFCLAYFRIEEEKNFFFKHAAKILEQSYRNFFLLLLLHTKKNFFSKFLIDGTLTIVKTLWLLAIAPGMTAEFLHLSFGLSALLTKGFFGPHALLV